MSPRNLRIAISQINVTVGDLDGNAELVINGIKQAKAFDADIVLFPELPTIGYPPEDLLLRPKFVHDNIAVLNKIIPASKGMFFMQIKILTVGKPRNQNISAIVEKFIKRLSHYTNISVVHVKEMKVTSGRKKIEILRGEREQICNKLEDKDFIITLDKRGKSFSSESFADFINKKLMESNRNLVFIIGGPLGLDEELINQAHLSLSFSQMTYPHELSLILLGEQLYRAFTILRGEKYHK